MATFGPPLKQQADSWSPKDLDFSDARVFAPGTHRGLFIIRLPDSEQWRLSDYLVGWFGGRDVASWSRCLVVATPNKVRVLRPPE
jgi:hypothetical protein